MCTAPQCTQQRLDELDAVDHVGAEEQVERAVCQCGAHVLLPAPVEAARGCGTQARGGRCVVRDILLQI